MENEFDFHHILIQHSMLLFFVLAGTLSITSLIVGAKLIIFFEKKNNRNNGADGEFVLNAEGENIGTTQPTRRQAK
jgi:hypothetical protein